MAFMTWTDDYATGIAVVDRQHQHLFDLVSGAAPILLDDTPTVRAEREVLFDELVAYTGEHFRTEEELMLASGVDRRVYEHHRQTHAKLVEEVLGWRGLLTSSDPGHGQQLLGFLAGWLMFHVLGEDQTMARQLRARIAGVAAERAYVEADGERRTPDDAALSRTVTGLYSQLSAQIREISQHNRHLEDEVRARTGELTVMAEDLRRARDAAEAASGAKSRFLAVVSHELRTPMNAIIGFTDALQRKGLSAAQSTLAERVDLASRQLAELIDGLIEYSRDEAGTEAPFELRALLDETCEGPFAAARAKGVVAQIEVAADLPPWLQGDATRIALIVRQLVANAAKFTDQGSIQVRVERREAGPPDSVGLRLSVSDTGVGIPADQQKNLFEPFHQVDDSATRRYGGVGLGLALTRQAARMLGGEIGMRSVLGQGSTFWLDLALPIVARPPAWPAALPAVPESTPTTPVVTTPTCQECDLTQALRDELDRLLEVGDTRVNEFLTVHEHGLRRRLGDRYENFAAQIGNFDYERALATLRGSNE